MEDMSLKVCPHPRGHVASCNGSLHSFKTKVEQYPYDPSLSASQRAALVEEWTEKETQRKALKLAQFQKEVKLRVSAREKLIQQEMVATSSKAMQSEQAAVERALRLDDTKVRPCVAMGHDVEDVKVMASGRDSHFSQYEGLAQPSSLQAARNSLLSQSYNHQNYTSEEKVSARTSLASVCQKHSANYQSVRELSSENCARRLTMDSTPTPEARHGAGRKSEPGIARKYIPEGQVEHMERLRASKQYLLFRRLYSGLEREQVRKKKLQSSHSRQVEAMKKRKEEERKRIEDGVASCLEQSSSLISTSISEEKQMAAEWAELMLQEEKKQQQQRAKETERYVAALKARLKEHVEMKKLVVPPLCSCAPTIWDTSPDTCANNCTFYKNTKAYVKALSHLIQSLNLH